MLRLAQHLHLLIPALRSSALRPEEEALRAALEEIDEEVRRPGGAGGRLRGKLNELWALVGAVGAARERRGAGGGGGGGVGVGGGGVEWTVVDEEGLAQIAQVSTVRCVRGGPLSCDMTARRGAVVFITEGRRVADCW